MDSVIDAIKFAMGNNGNPVVIAHSECRREIAERLVKEFSVKSAILFTREEISAALDGDIELDVIIFDGESDYKDYLEKAFNRFPKARKVCFAKDEFWNDMNLYDTVLVG